MKISLQQAKYLILKEQGLITSPFDKGKKGALAVIEHLGYLQIDTLNVVTRAHHHTLWSRLPDYKESFLNELLEKDKQIFEYWSHAASYLPMVDFRFSLPRKKLYASGKSHWFAQDKKMNKYVLDRIRAEGPLQSKNFEFKRDAPGNWYNWKPAKRALEQLFMEGKLMVAKRHNFQKIYDLAERVVPSTVDTSFPSNKEYADYMIRKMIHANGMATITEISYLRAGLKEIIAKEVKRMLKTGELVEISVETLKGTYLTTPHQLNRLQTQTQKNRQNAKNSTLHLLSPFDNLIIQRKRLNAFFQFDYTIECYLPERKRKFGYWCLPVLYNNDFVARYDAKADRVTGEYYIKSMHFEKNFSPNEGFNLWFMEKTKAFAAFNGCTKIIIQKADNAQWKRQINTFLK